MHTGGGHNPPNLDNLAPLQFSGMFAGGLRADIRRRIPAFYKSDWTDAFAGGVGRPHARALGLPRSQRCSARAPSSRRWLAPAPRETSCIDGRARRRRT